MAIESSYSSDHLSYEGSPLFQDTANPEIDKWSDAINDAAYIADLPPGLIGAMMNAESSGNPDESSTNDDGQEDKGLMQISQERWDSELAGHLTKEEEKKIREITGKSPRQLNMSDPKDNLIAGAIEIAHKVREEHGNLRDALAYYESGDPDDSGPYAKNVMQYWHELDAGKKLSTDPFGDPSAG